MEDESKICDKVWEIIKDLPNVCGYSRQLQPRIKEGKILNSELCVRVYVTKKVKDLPDSQMIARTYWIGKNRQIETDIVEIGAMKALCSSEPTHANPRDRFRPVMIGISSCHINCTACTVGGIVRDKDCKNIYLLSNNHCYALSNEAKLGDAIVQPSPFDGGTLCDVVGKLVRYVPIRFSTSNCIFRRTLIKIQKSLGYSLENRVDCAIAKLTADWENKVLYLGKIKGEKEPQIGDIVQKVGRTTGLTTGGRIVDTSFSGYVYFPRGLAFFTDQILIHKAGFSAPGDSGSRVLTMDNYSVGLLFAGSETYSLANKMSNVYRELNVVPLD